jgi:gluconokinase/shikimate kinase
MYASHTKEGLWMTEPVAKPMVLVVMGVSGCGKTTVAAILSGRLNWQFEEGDALHPQSNIDKMHAGHPLTDEDRAPWLEKVADWVDACLDAGQNGLITCSALKRAYRDVINRRGSGVTFVYLAGSRDVIAARLTARHGHFMPPTLLDSQFAALEEPTPDEPAVRVDVGPAPSAIAQTIIQTLGLTPATGNKDSQ